MRSQRARHEIDDLVSRGWKIREETPERVVMFKPAYGGLLGHGAIFLLTAWWTLGLGNLAYAAWNYVENSRRRIVWNESTRICSECGTENAPDASYCMACGTALVLSEETEL